MAKLDAQTIARFQQYVKDVDEAVNHLEFLFDNLGENLNVDFSRDSLVEFERLFWKHVDAIPNDLSDAEHLAILIGQYLGLMIVKETGAKWIQCIDQNPMFGQPCLDGFGNKEWDRIYPVSIAINLRNLPKTNPTFPGVREKQVFAKQYDKAVKIYEKTQAATS